LVTIMPIPFDGWLNIAAMPDAEGQACQCQLRWPCLLQSALP